jgi:hypothetical protein
VYFQLRAWEPSDQGFWAKALAGHVQPDDGDACRHRGPPWRRHRGLPQLDVSRVKILGPWAGQWRRFCVASFLKPLSWDVVLLCLVSSSCLVRRRESWSCLASRGSSRLVFLQAFFCGCLTFVPRAARLAGGAAPSSLGEGIGFPSGSLRVLCGAKARVFFPECGLLLPVHKSRWLSSTGDIPGQPCIGDS